MVKKTDPAANPAAPAAAPACPEPRSAALLAWYDRHCRILPWRAAPGIRPDPYHVWLSEIMLQQTVVETVKPYFAKFLALWPDIRALAAAEDQAVLAAWAGLGYYARARNLIACARAVAARPGAAFPQTEAELRSLPGIGPYTAAAIAAIAFNEPALVIDGNIERVMTRLALIETPLPQAKAEIAAALAPMVPAARPGDFAQALMDLGAGICRPRNPDCLLCPLLPHCRAQAAGRAAEFPVKPAKAARPVKHGTAYLAFDPAGRLLLGTRPAKGLLAGMAEVPNSGWAIRPPPETPPFAAEWTRLNTLVVHVFTHFELRLTVARTRLATAMPPPPGLRWVEPAALPGEALPTLFRKVISAGS